MPKISDLAAGAFLTTTELTPPKGADAAPLLATARSLSAAVDAFNLTDSHNARMSMAPLAAARLLLEAGIEPIVQMTSRDRNRIAIQADLLAAAALGVSNVTLMTGDAPTRGDHPDAKAVFDLNSSELIAAAATLNGGRDIAGAALNGAPNLCIGAVVNPGADDLDVELGRMAAKVEAGARFFQTQAIYDVAAFEAFRERLERFGLAEVVVLAGIIPLKSARMARYLNANVPGIKVPDALIGEIDAAADVAATSVATAAGIVAALKPLCQGVHIMALGQEAWIPAIMEQAGLKPKAGAGR